MRGMIFRFAGCVLAMPLASYLLPGIQSTNTTAALLTGVMLGLVYLVLRPIAKLLLSVFNLLTLGLLGVAIDAWMVMLAGTMVPGFLVGGFWWALLAAVIVNIVREIMGALAKR